MPMVRRKMSCGSIGHQQNNDATRGILSIPEGEEMTQSSFTKLIFAHQGKTGGTTMVEILRNHFGVERCYADMETGQRWTMHPLHRAVVRWLEPFRDYRTLGNHIVIHGHFSSRKYRRAFPDAIYITLYREPVQQLVSLYYFWKTNDKEMMPGNPYRMKLLEQRLDLIGFAELMAPRFKAECHQFQPEAFDFIGITEHYKTTLRLLKKRFIPELDIDDVAVFRVNARKAVDEPYSLDEMTRMRLKELLAPKIALYKRALHRFEQDCHDSLGDS